jgi:hypothetical protein
MFAVAAFDIVLSLQLDKSSVLALRNATTAMWAIKYGLSFKAFDDVLWRVRWNLCVMDGEFVR